MTTLPIDLVLSRLDGYKLRAIGRHRWRACCPAHGGRNASTLSIGVGVDESVLLKCFAGCSADEVARALGLELSDLFPAKGGGGAPPMKRRALLSARQALDVIEFETLLIGTAAFNLANGHALTAADLERLAVARERIVAVIDEVRA